MNAPKSAADLLTPNQISHSPVSYKDTTTFYNAVGSAWIKTMGNRFSLLVFAGKSSKPIEYSAQPTEQAAQLRARKLLEDLQEIADRKVKAREDAKAQRKEIGNPFKVGDVFNTSWGYDQTNVDFYVVTAVKGLTMTVRSAGSKIVRSEQGMDYVVPDVNHLGKDVSRVILRNINANNPRESSFKIDGHYAHLWNGKPVYETAFGYGH